MEFYSEVVSQYVHDVRGVLDPLCNMFVNLWHVRLVVWVVFGFAISDACGVSISNAPGVSISNATCFAISDAFRVVFRVAALWVRMREKYI